MRKLLSVILAISMVFSMVVMAAPVTVSTVETAQEEVAVDFDGLGELDGVVTVKPGINMLTGTTEPLTGENTTNAALNSLTTRTYSAPFTVSDDPLGIKGKVMNWYIAAGKGNYPSMDFAFGGGLDSLLGHHNIHFVFDVAEVVNYTSEDTFIDKNAFWIMNSTTSGEDVAASPTTAVNGGWKTVNLLLDLSKGKTLKTKNPTSFKLEAEVRAENTVDTNFYLDNFYAVPAYRFNFYTPDGETLLKTEYKAFGDDGKVITTLPLEAGLYGDYYVSGWSTSVGGKAIETYELNNENVNFYATEYIPAITVSCDGELSSTGATATLTPNIIGALRSSIVASRGSWTIENEDVATIVTNSNGTATVTAVSEGKTTATFTVAGVNATYEVEVVFPYEVNSANLATGATEALNPADYRALVLQLNDAVSGTDYSLEYSIDGSETKSIAFETCKNDGVYDLYADLTELEGWVSGSSVTFTFSNTDATVNSLKLYNSFDPSFSLDIDCETALLTSPAEEIVITADFASKLTGVYDESYTWTVTDESDVVSYKAYEDGSLKIRANVGTGVVSVTATSNEDTSYSVTKDIYVNVDSTKYGMFHDFLGVTELSEANVKPCGGDAGNTTLTLVDDMLHLDKQNNGNNNGGVEPYSKISVPATQKYLVVKTTADSAWIKFYYKWDSQSHAEANTVSTTTASTVKIDNGDGTVTYIMTMANIPEDASNITGYMISMNYDTTVDIIYYYTAADVSDLAITKAVGHKWDATSTNFSVSGHHKLSVFDDAAGNVTLTESYAYINGKNQKVEATSTTLSDGSDGYKLKITGSGSLNPRSYPSSLILADYPYLWIKYKANKGANVNLYLMDSDKGGSESGYDNKMVSLQATSGDDFVTAVYYLPDLGYSASLNTKLTNMMFAYRGPGYLSNEILSSAVEGTTTYYYVSSPLEFSSKTYAIIDEIAFANYDPTAETPTNIELILSPDKEEITTDSGSVTITANVYSNKPLSTDAVIWSVVQGSVKAEENEDGTLTVTATGNGDAVIKATALEDTSFSATITIPVSGQREKVASYEFKYYALGNSYLSHGPFDGWIWTDASKGNRGMAATTYEKDYYHRVQYYLTNGFNATLTAARGNYAGLERAANYDSTAANPIDTVDEAVAAIKAHAQFKEIQNHLTTQKPNVITVQLSENFGSPYSDDITRAFYDTVYGMINEYRPPASVVVVMTPFQTGTRPAIIKEYAAKFGFYVADMSDVPSYSVIDLDNRYLEYDGVTYDRGTKDAWKYNPYMAWADHPYYDTYRDEYYAENKKYPTEFRTHPGDMGMDLIGQRMFAQFKNAIPSYLDAEYIYIPESISIDGADAITTLGGSITLTPVAYQADAANDVVWSVDNEKIATIDQNGVLTAVNNGTVVVTAVSAYNEEITATKTVTVSGQPAVYTLTYKAGTTDTVTNLPESDSYARDTYTLSTLVPERNGYKFLGWSLTENGETVTEIVVDKNTDIYAVWAFAESWHFDRDGDFEGVNFSGFNTSVKDGLGTVVHYGDGVVIADTTLLLNSDNFNGFNVKMAVSGSTADVNTVSVIINSTEGTYTYTADTTALGEQLLYTFDISEVTGTITGFSVAPSAKDATAIVDWIEFVRTSLDNDVEVDTVNVVSPMSVDLGGNTYTIGTLVADNDITFENGTVVIGEVTGNGVVYVNGSVVYTGTAPEGYISVNVGAKANEANVRYFEWGGYQHLFDGDILGLVWDGIGLIQVVEKTSPDSVTTVASTYYLASSDGFVEVEGLNDSIDNINELDLRVKTPAGIRYKAGILNSAKTEKTAFEITEYGFVVGIASQLEEDLEQLTLDYKNVVTGSAYNTADGTDKVFSNDGTITHFTAVLYGIPESGYNVKLVSKTFTKVAIDGSEYVVYGEPIVASAYDIAKALEPSMGDISEDAQEFVQKIITVVEG